MVAARPSCGKEVNSRRPQSGAVRAIQRGFKLPTPNPKDFRHIPGLQMVGLLFRFMN